MVDKTIKELIYIYVHIKSKGTIYEKIGEVINDRIVLGGGRQYVYHKNITGDAASYIMC